MDLKEGLLIQYNLVKERNERVLEGLTREELIWQPAPNGKSIGMIFSVEHGGWINISTPALIREYRLQDKASQAVVSFNPRGENDEQIS